MRVFALDNTFGHNPGQSSLAFSLADRLAIVQELDGFGIDYAEMGCPGARASVRKFFSYAATRFRPAQIRLVASVRLDAVRDTPERDEEIRAAIDASAPVVALNACCWQAGAGDHQEFCRWIGEIVRFLKAHSLEVIFREEDFFQSYGREPLFALRALESAKAAGADVLSLGDSSGSGMPHLVREICIEVRKRFVGILGICAHDDSDLALANTLEAVDQGFTLVEGSLNASGTRCGVANLCSIISTLEQKLGYTVIGLDDWGAMSRVARLVAAAEADARTSEESPLDIADQTLVSGLTEAGRRDVLGRLELLRADGYDLRAAGGTLELLVRDALEPDLRPFVAERYELATHSGRDCGDVSAATVTLRVGEQVRSETEDGDGAVNALERSLRQCLFAVYPEIANLRVTDLRVQMLDGSEGTSVRAQVSLDWTDGLMRWTTQGVAGDLIEASWLALVDGFRLHLMRLAENGRGTLTAPDTSWAV